jgi:hypothetical protein
MTTDAEATEIERKYLVEVISELDSLYDDLIGVTYPDADLQVTRRALGLILGLGIRQVKAAHADVVSGWVPECFAHVRPGWEVGVDLAFLLSHDREHRAELAHEYIHMTRLRNASIRQVLDGPARFERAGAGLAIEELRSLMARYEGSPCARRDRPLERQEQG